MKYFFLCLLVIFAGFSAGFYWRYDNLYQEHSVVRNDENFSRYDSRLLETPPEGWFDATVEISGQEKGKDQSFRLFFDARDEENYLTVEVTNNYAKILAVEAGAARELAKVARDDRKLPETVRLKRRGHQIELVCDSQSLLIAVHDGFPGGRVGVGVAGGLKATDPVVQPVESLVFLDDFMRGANETGAWTSINADWEVRSLDNPARSSNAFIYQGVSQLGGISLVGARYWDDYQVTVSALGAKNGEIGLILAAGEPRTEKDFPEQYCKIRWTARVSTENSGVLELIRAGKDEKVLASLATGYVPGQWYRLSATLSERKVCVLIDGREVLSAVDPVFSGGRAGLYVKGLIPAEFDDFSLFSLTGTDKSAITAFNWQYYGGSWQNKSDRLACMTNMEYASFALTGRENWENVTVSANLQGAGGVVLAFRDPANFIKLEIDGNQGKICEIKEGVENILAAGDAGFVGGNVTLQFDRGHLSAGNLHAFLDGRFSGRVGLLAPPHTDAVSFAGFSAREVEHPLPVVTINEIFDEENLMAIWSGVGGEWKGGKPAKYGKNESGAREPWFDEAYWHRSLFFGDAELEAVLPEEREKNWRLALSLAKPFSSDKKNNGYLLDVTREEDGLRVKIIREGETKAEEKLPQTLESRRLRFRQAGQFLIGYVDDQPVILWRDQQPLRGTKVAWAQSGLNLDPAAVQIYSRCLRDYSFNRAPADWRKAGGVWQVTNRWECDPRWSFMAGMPPFLAESRAKNLEQELTESAKWKLQSLRDQLALVPDPESKLAAMWYKGQFAGDVVLETYMGQMMDAKRGGGNYKNYVQSLCLNLASDGKNLDTGYSFIFGGWKNTKSAILKDGKIVAEAPQGIPVQMSIHRMWYRVRAERQGDTVTFSAYTQQTNRARDEECLLYLTYKDPEPPKGKHLAVWSWDNGMMLARLRIGAEKFGEMESPFEDYPLEANCVYGKE